MFTGVATTGSCKERVDLVNKDNARGVLASLLEELADALGSNTDEHFIKVGPRAEDEVAL